ncbi:PDZ domain-containing protein [Luteococcus peritonei]
MSLRRGAVRPRAGASRLGPVTPQTWTAIVSAACFVVLAVLLAVVRVPFVAWRPGTTIDLLGNNSQGRPALEVEGIKTYPVQGELRMTTVSVTRVNSHLSLPEALWAYWMPNRDVLVRDSVYAPNKSAQQVESDQVAMMDTSRKDAEVAALRAAGQPVQVMPQIRSVGVAGPSFNKLQPGDLIERVDQTEVRQPADVAAIVAKHAVGDPVVLSVLRDGKSSDVTVTTVSSNKDKKKPVIGIVSQEGYLYSPRVTYGIDPQVVGPSAGLVFSLAIYDRITEAQLVAGRKVAGTGTISADGTVGGIGGIQEKIAGAEDAGSQIFLVPAPNCIDIEGVSTDMTLVKVTTLADAVSSLKALREDPKAQVPGC